MKVLIIGGEGYIGSRLYNFLSLANLAVTRYGNKQHDYNLLPAEFLNQYDYIILLAGHSSVPSCMGELKSPWNNNVRNFANLISKLYDSQKVIYASSSSVYGNSYNKQCIESNMSFCYMNNYDLTKTVLDQVALNYISAGKQIIGLRFGTVAGSSDIIRRDILINSMMYSALTKNEIHISNANIYRPYLSIFDLCRGIQCILETNFISGIYNMANNNYKIVDYARAIQLRTNANIIVSGTQGVPYDFQIDSNKFINNYQFKYMHDLDDVINELIYSYNSNCKTVMRDSYFYYE